MQMGASAGLMIVVMSILGAFPTSVFAQEVEQTEADRETTPSAVSEGVTHVQLPIARPREQAEWIRAIAEHYPTPTVRVEPLEGTTEVMVTVGTDGRVLGCRVLDSSGHSFLDEVACSGMQRYARFYPALDDNGAPTEGIWTTSITWQIP